MIANIVAVAAGGAVGASLRYLASAGVTRALAGVAWAAALPVGTFAVNVFGCLVIGMLSVLLGSLAPARPQLSLFLVTGVLGGFTTMSSFSNEALTLWQAGQHMTAFGYVVGTVLVCLSAVAAGHALAQLLLH